MKTKLTKILSVIMAVIIVFSTLESSLSIQAFAAMINEHSSDNLNLIGTTDMTTLSETPLYMLGDVNENSKVDIGDAILTARYIAGLDELNEMQKFAADVNETNKVDIGDAILIARYIAGLDDLPLPVPTGLACVLTTSDSVSLSWNRVANVKTYEVLYNDVVLKTELSSIVVTGLEADTEYTFTVRAIDETSSGKLSSALVVKTLVQDTPPENAEYDFDIINNNEYTLAITGTAINSFDTTVFTVTYDPSKLELIDFAAQTEAINTQAGKIKDTDIEILSNDEGIVEFKASKQIADGKAWSGVLTTLRLKALSNDNATIKFDKITTADSNAQEVQIEQTTGIKALAAGISKTIEANPIKEETQNIEILSESTLDASEISDSIVDAEDSEDLSQTELPQESENTVPSGIGIQALAADQPVVNTKQYPSAAFNFDEGVDERINLNTGSLVYEENIANLPGRNGLDLNLTVQYDMDMANNISRTNMEEVTEDQYIPQNQAVRGYYFEPWVAQYKVPSGMQPSGLVIPSDVVKNTIVIPPYPNQYLISGPTRPDSSDSDIDFLTKSQMYKEAQRYLDGKTEWRRKDYPSKGWDTIVTDIPQVFRESTVWGPFETDYYMNTLKADKWGDNPLNYMGIGWSLNFTRIDIDDKTDDKYLRLSNGSTYKIDMELGGSNLKNYKLNDLSIKEDGGTYFSSRYVLTYGDGKKEYFDASGNIACITDRYNNKITFQRSGKNITITDSVGAVTTVTFANNTYTIKLPDNSMTSFAVKTVDGYEYLDKKTDALGQVTTYSYEKVTGPFNYLQRVPAHEDIKDTPKDITYHNLKSVKYPTGAERKYTYASTQGNIGSYGVYTYYRIATRCDNDGVKDCNSASYTYNQDYTGFDLANWFQKTGRYYSGPDDLEDTLSYGTTVTYGNGLKKSTTFNSKHLTWMEHTYNASKQTQFKQYEYSDNRLPIRIDNTISGTSSISTTERFEYDNYGNIKNYWNPLGNGFNSEYQTTMGYDYLYNILTSKTYKKDAATTIEEAYTLTPDRKAVATKKVSEIVNGVRTLKSQTDFTYNTTYGNLLSMKNYYDNSSFIQTDFEYSKDVFVTKKTTNGISENFTYDTIGRVLTSTDANGNKTSYEYDVLGRTTKATHPDDSYVQSKYVVSSTQNQVTTTDEMGAITVNDYDKLGNITSVKANGILMSSFSYDNMMRLKESVDANNVKTAYTYDYLDRILTKNTDNLYIETYEYADALTSEESRVTKTITGETNAPSIKTAVYTDKFGRNTKDSIFDGSTEISNIYSYDYVGNKISDLTAKDKSEGRLYSNKYEYDYAGNVTKLTNNENGVFSTTYDLLGRKTSSTDPKGSTATCEYDGNGRLKTETLPFENDYYTTKSYIYDNNGNITSQKASNNKPGESKKESRTDYAYNNRNWLEKVASYNGDAVENYTEYSYDKIGNKTEMRTANGTQKTLYEYDKFNRLVKLTDPLGQVESYKYDNNGNLTEKTDRNDNVTTNEYDKLNRVTNVSAKSSGVTAPEFIKYTYAKTGVVLTEENENLKTSKVYDNLGRLVKQTESNGIEKSYAYDLANNRTSFVLTQDGTVKTNTIYTYDSMNRLQTVSDKGVLSATYTYDINGNRASLAYPNGVTTTYEYNKANLVTSLTNKNDSTVLSSYAYTYYLDGNQASKADNTGRKTVYAYDGLGRLTEEAETSSTGNITKAYEFDKAGNRSKMTVSGTENYVTTYVYDDNNRLLTEITAKDGVEEIGEYAYDANGNQISKLGGVITNVGTGYSALGIYEISDKTAYENGFTCELDKFDVFNRLVGVQKNGKTAKYAYKADGLRLSKEVDGEKTIHVWDRNNMVLEFGANNDRYIRGIGLVKSDNNKFYLYNAHGDVVQLSDENGNVTKHYYYDAFGVETTKDDADNNPFRYCGEYFDKETDTIYLRARYYNPMTGRFMTQDPIRDGLNWYTYCKNNPIMFIDFTGLWNEFVPAPNYVQLRQWFDRQYTYCKDHYDSFAGVLDWNSDTGIASMFMIGNGYGGYAEFKSGVDGSYIENGRMYVDENLLWKAFGKVIDPPAKINTTRDTIILASAIVLIGKGPAIVKGAEKLVTTYVAPVIIGLGAKGADTIQAGINFTKTTLQRMQDPARFVPVSTLMDAIKYGTPAADSQGTNAIMYTIEMYKNGTAYQLEVLYDKATNTILHFLYK